MGAQRMFTRFEIFWHWSQAVLIFGSCSPALRSTAATVLGFGKALAAHVLLAWSLIALWAFAIFWHLTTGEWRQYIPAGSGVMRMVTYYAYGIFSGEAKPFVKTPSANTIRCSE